MVVTAEGGFAIATHANAFVTFWRAPASLEKLATLKKAEQELVDRSPSGIVVLTVLTEAGMDFKRDSKSERAEATAIARHFASVTRAHAYVIEGTGFRLATLRAMIAGVNAFARVGHPTRVFDGADAAIDWLAPFGNLDGDGVRRALAEARARLT